MPELPEVESARRLVDKSLDGRIIIAATFEYDEIVFSELNTFRAERLLMGGQLAGSWRHGKYLCCRFISEVGTTFGLMFHLGMTGDFFRHAVKEPPRFHKLTFTLDDETALSFTNTRRLGRVFMLDDGMGHPRLDALGPDAFWDLPSVMKLQEHLSRKTAPIKSVLLDQRWIAGVGNWIADEVLYQSGIAPGRSAKGLTHAEVSRLRGAIEEVVKLAVDVSADEKRFPDDWLFHVRWGKDLGARSPAGNSLRFDSVGGRTTCWSPHEQQ